MVPIKQENGFLTDEMFLSIIRSKGIPIHPILKYNGDDYHFKYLLSHHKKKRISGTVCIESNEIK